ncbi:kinase-like domain-containing protein [Xylariomycetidae sp. FL2044]|nr:kinase-like domain-containing protein [Xylariomycetidae sp. FL2044]
MTASTQNTEKWPRKWLEEKVIFCLRPLNARAIDAAAASSAAGALADKNGDLLIPIRARFKPNDLRTLVTFGSSDANENYIHIPGSRILENHCSFVINIRTGMIMFQDFSDGYCGVDGEQNAATIPLPDADKPRVLVARSINPVIWIGGSSIRSARFRLEWNLNPQRIRKLIKAHLPNFDQNISGTPDDGISIPRLRDRAGNRWPIEHVPRKTLQRSRYEKVMATIDTHTGQRMVVKQLKAPSSRLGQIQWRDSVKRRLDRQALIQSKLDHIHIQEFIGAQQKDEKIVEVFTTLEDGSFSSLLRNSDFNQQQELQLTFNMVGQCLSALDYLEMAKVVHRNIKPESILYSMSHRGEFTFKLGNFALADLAPTADISCGTRSYQAPEIYLGNQHTPKADIYSLLVTVLWGLDINDFRQKLDNGYYVDNTTVQSEVFYALHHEKRVERVRAMGIWDPAYRASATQMLIVLFGTFGATKMTSKWLGVTQLSATHFQDWEQAVETCNAPYGVYLNDLKTRWPPRQI